MSDPIEKTHVPDGPEDVKGPRTLPHVTICDCVTEREGRLHVTIPRAEYEAYRAAVEALAQCVDDFGGGHCCCEQAKREAIEALAALRSAGIHETEGGDS